MSILGLLGIVFVILKLIGVIAWSWWLVLLPFYGLIALVILALLFGAGTFTLFYSLTRPKRRKR